MPKERTVALPYWLGGDQSWADAVVRLADYMSTTEECQPHHCDMDMADAAITLARKTSIDSGLLCEALICAIRR